jgi:hypothetical protein
MGILRHSAALLCLGVFVGCSSPASNADSSDEAVQTGSRWRSHLADGFYDGTNVNGHPAIFRLWSSATTQYFDFASEVDEHSGCTGGVDVAVGGAVTFVGDDGSCRYSVLPATDTLELRDSAGNSFVFLPRAEDALAGTFANEAGSQIVVDRSDSSGVTFTLTAPDGAEVFKGQAAWGAPTSWDMGHALAPAYFAPFSAPFMLASGCRAALYADSFDGLHALSVWSPDDAEGHCMPDAAESAYTKR